MARPDDEADSSPGSGGRLLLALIAGQLGLHSAMAGLRLAAPLQALDAGASAWEVGVLLALFAAAPVLLAMWAGRLADRHGYHRPVRLAVALSLAGLGLALVSTTAAAEASRLAWLCAAAALTGTAANMGLIAIQRTAGLAARGNVERMRIFSWLGVAPSFANVVGPVSAGFLIDGAGYTVTYAVLLALPLVSLAAARAVPRQARPASMATRGTAWDLLKTPGMKRLLAVNGLLSACWDVHAFAVPILGHDRGFSASTIGLVLGTFTLSVTGVRLLIPWIAHRLQEAVVLRLAMIGTALVFAGYPFAGSPWVMGILAALLGVTLGSVQPMIMSALHHLTPHERHGEALAFRSMTINASSTMLPLLFGAAGTLVGTGVLFWVVGCAVGAGSWMARGLGPGAAAAARG